MTVDPAPRPPRGLLDLAVARPFPRAAVIRRARRTAVLEATRREVTWISDDIRSVYLRLHERGFASSISVHQDGGLVGGPWGIEVGRTFGLISVSHRVDHAGSMALIAIVNRIGDRQRWQLVDVGLLQPPHLGRDRVPVAREPGGDEAVGRAAAGLR